jgi:hypothetical protein
MHDSSSAQSDTSRHHHICPQLCLKYELIRQGWRGPAEACSSTFCCAKNAIGHDMSVGSSLQPCSCFQSRFLLFTWPLVLPLQRPPFNSTLKSFNAENKALEAPQLCRVCKLTDTHELNYTSRYSNIMCTKRNQTCLQPCFFRLAKGSVGRRGKGN